MNLEGFVDKVFQMRAQFREEIEDILPGEIGHAAEEIFSANFEKQGFDTGTGIEAWAPLKRPRLHSFAEGTLSDILVKTGKGRSDVENSMRTPEVSEDLIRIPFALDDDYMQYHNTGTSHVPMREFAGDSELIEQMVMDKIVETLNFFE